MITSKSIFYITLIASGILADNTKLRELIVRVHGKSDSATVYYIGNDEEEFLFDFMKNDDSIIPLSTFNADFSEKLRHCTNIIIVFQVPGAAADKDHHTYSKLLRNVIKSLQIRKFVIISARTLDILNQYFTFFGKSKFTRIFGMLANTSSYAYLPYAEKSIQQLAENGPLPDSLNNLNGFAFRTTIVEDAPRVFWYSYKSGEKRIGGQVGQIFLQFLRRHNATFHEIPMNNSMELYVMDAIINLTLNHEIDISMNAHFRQKNIDLSYPITIETNVMMVPRNGYLDPNEYFLRPFKPKTWMCIGLTAIFMIIFKIILNLLTNSNLVIWGSFSEIYLTLLSSSSGQPIVSNYRFHLLVLLFGFIFERLYGSHFQSFLTVYIKIKQYDTIQDLFDNNVPVMISNFEWEAMGNDDYPKGFDKIVFPTDPVEVIGQCISMKNTSFAYFVEADRGQFFINFQSLYKKSLFRIAQQTISSYHIGFLLEFHSPFKEILDNFIIEIRQTGLIQKWDSDVMYQVKATHLQMHMDTDHLRTIEVLHEPLTVNHLEFAWKWLIIGLAVSAVVFVIEWVWYIVKNSKFI